MKTKVYTFQIEYSELSISEFMERYHFENKDISMVEAIGRFLTEYIHIQAGVITKDDETVCMVTLRKAFDDFEELLARQEKILMSYCAECFGMEFLSKAYEKISHLNKEETGYYLTNYHFLELEILNEERYKSFGKQVGIYLDNGMIKPLKSVVYTAEYSKVKPNSCIDCSKCDNINCSFRDTKNAIEESQVRERIYEQVKYSYGAKRIFGEEEI